VKELFSGVYQIDEGLATRNLFPGKKVYGERLVRIGDEEFRLWSPRRSKLSAAIKKGLKKMPICGGLKVLYLGAASGTTASHVSDIIGEDGTLFCVESAVLPMKKLLRVCGKRDNMIPFLADANKPLLYAPFLEEVDLIYQDIAQKNQAHILTVNSDLYLGKRGSILLAVKSRSIDSTRKSRAVIPGEIAKLKPSFKIKEVVELAPFEKDHSLVLAEKR
jgi:fibrillarin-like pre-rRNA processing protein